MFRPIFLTLIFAASSASSSTLGNFSELTLTRFDERSGQNVTVDASSGEVKFITEFQQEGFFNGVYSLVGETRGGGDWYFQNTGTSAVAFDQGDIQTAVDFDINLDQSLFDGTFDEVGVFFELVIDVLSITQSGFEFYGSGTYSRTISTFSGLNETKIDLGRIYPSPDVVQNDDTRFEATFTTLDFELDPGEEVIISIRPSATVGINSSTPISLVGEGGLAVFDGLNTTSLSLNLDDSVEVKSTVAGVFPEFASSTEVAVVPLPASVLLLGFGLISLAGLRRLS